VYGFRTHSLVLVCLRVSLRVSLAPFSVWGFVFGFLFGFLWHLFRAARLLYEVVVEQTQ